MLCVQANLLPSKDKARSLRHGIKRLVVSPVEPASVSPDSPDRIDEPVGLIRHLP